MPSVVECPLEGHAEELLMLTRMTDCWKGRKEPKCCPSRRAFPLMRQMTTTTVGYEDRGEASEVLAFSSRPTPSNYVIKSSRWLSLWKWLTLELRISRLTHC